MVLVVLLVLRALNCKVEMVLQRHLVDNLLLAVVVVVILVVAADHC